jgi:hypothetical protein
MGYTYDMDNPGSNDADAYNVQVLLMITGEDKGLARRAGAE